VQILCVLCQTTQTPTPAPDHEETRDSENVESPSEPDPDEGLMNETLSVVYDELGYETRPDKRKRARGRQVLND